MDCASGNDQKIRNSLALSLTNYNKVNRPIAEHMPKEIVDKTIKKIYILTMKQAQNAQYSSVSP